MPAWVWPKSQKTDTSIAVRLGRVLHWIGVGMFTLLLLGGVVMAVSTASNASASVQQHAEWETRHPVGANGSRVGTPRPADADEYWSDPDQEPYLQHVEWGLVLAFPIVGAAFAMVGRGLRYIIAGE